MAKLSSIDKLACRAGQGDIQFLRTAFPDFALTIEDKAADGDKIWVRMTAPRFTRHLLFSHV